MNKSLFLFQILLTWATCSHNVYGQVKPNTLTQPGAGSATLNTLPTPYGSDMPVNFVRVWDAIKPFYYDTAVSSNERTDQQVKQSTQYFDGLGRPLQTVSKGVSPNGFDLVSTVLYDAYGRETFKYLPYVSTSNDGRFKSNPFAEQNTFIKSLYNPANAGAGEKFFYGKTDYEPSPLNRVAGTYAPGNNWVGDAKGVTTAYLVNGLQDSVCIWNIGYAYADVPVFGGYYNEGELFENIITDEDGKKTVEYKNRQGQLLLKKSKSAATSYEGHTGWACTYYVYDDIGNLRFVLQPKATSYLLNNGWLFDNNSWRTSSVARELCFSYEYDAKQRMTIKRIPGAGEILMVYDSRDRLVMTQDSVQRAAGKWLYTDYDLLNRANLTGIWTNASDRAIHQAAAESSLTYPAPSSGYTILTQNYYDDYSWVSGTGLSGVMITTYSNNTNYFQAADNNNFPYPQAIAASYQVRGIATGSKLNVVGTTNYLYTVNYFDDRMRVIETQNTNNSGGKDTTVMQYSYTGQLLRTLVCHGKGGANAQAYKVLTKNVYDNSGRLLQVNKKIANSPEVIIVKNEYNELGQLAQKNIGQKRNSAAINTYTSNNLDSLIFSYNIRGWLRGINKDYARNINGATNWFGEELCYDFGFTSNELNGNIAGIRWRSGSDGQERSYGFTYDNLNRLTKADFTQHVGNNVWDISAGVDFSLKSMSYDLNGNILTLNQKGLKINTSVTIDSLKYNYVANSNRLNYVTDKLNDPAAKLGDFTEVNNNTTQDYWYDGNGNMNKDNNKQISSISYNYLNLPEVITVTGKGTISYTYDATGNKLKKTTVDNTVTPSKITVTDYQGLFNYQNDTLQYISHEEGRARTKSNYNKDTVWFDYFEKDHLGNVRVVLTDEIKQDVYPALTLEGTYGSGTAAVDVEKNYYDVNNAFIVANTTVTGITAYTNNNGNPPYNNNPNSATGENSARLYKLNSNTNKTGLGITLKVMTGDRIDVYGKSYWFQNNASGSNANIPLADIITGLLGAPTGAVDGKGATLGLLTGGTVPTSLPSSLLNRTPTAGDVKPNAGINWILFDEQFHYVSYGSSMSGNNGVVKSHNTDLQNIQVTKSGFIYIYVSNQSPVDVFFDNLQVIHTRGPLLETTEYYPFGLNMAGTSSKALNFGEPGNKHKLFGKEIQNKEFNDGSGLEWYDYGMREYNQQIARFFRIDPITEKFYQLSPYQYCSNDPIKNVDLDGAEGLDFRIFNKLVQNTVKNPNGTSAKVLGAVVGVGGSVQGAIQGTGNAIAHPVQTLKGLGNMLSKSPVQNAVDYGVNVSSQYSGSGSDAFTKYAATAHVLTDIGMALSPLKEGSFTKEGTLAKNVFNDLTSINDIGKMGETLTKGVLEKQFKGAEILEQVNMKMDGASMTADFVVVKDGKVVGVFESKVNGSSLSNGQKLFFNDGDAATLLGKNAGALEGTKIDPSTLKTGVYRWDAKTGSFTVQ